MALDKRQADIAIETALALRLLFRLPFRQTEALLGSVLKLMGLLLPRPDHTTLSRCNATVTIRYCVEFDDYPNGIFSHEKTMTMSATADFTGSW